MQEKVRVRSKTFGSHLLIFFLSFSVSGCFSISGTLGEYFSSLQMAYMSEDDPELVKSSLPLNMKILEAMILKFPEDHFLLSAASSIFVSYTYGFVLDKADMLRFDDYERSQKLYKRSLKLLNRGTSYAMRSVKAKYPDLKVSLRNKNSKEIAEVIKKYPFKKEDVETLYYAAASYAGAIVSSRGDTFYILKLPILRSLIEKSLSLDSGWNDGALYTAMISLVLLDTTKKMKDKKEQAVIYFNRAVIASDSNNCSPYITLAENLSVQQQDKKGFLELVDKALKVDTKKHFKNRLVNVLCQRKALWLRQNVERLFS